MSDGQSEACESIARQNAAVSVRLERGESVKWHDGEQWQTGVVLKFSAIRESLGNDKLVQTCEGIYAVDRDALEPYPPRCEECGGEGAIRVEWGDLSGRHAGTFEFHTCPACGGSGRRKHA